MATISSTAAFATCTGLKSLRITKSTSNAKINVGSSGVKSLTSEFLSLRIANAKQITPVKTETLKITAEKKYKLKTHKASAKRFRVTGSGKVVRRRAWRAHLLRKKSTARKNRLAGMVTVFRGDLDKIVGALPYLKANRKPSPPRYEEEEEDDEDETSE